MKRITPRQVQELFAWSVFLTGSLLAVAMLFTKAEIVSTAYAQQEEPPGRAAQREVRVESAQELARMEAHLRSRYDASDVRHSFTLATGDEIDCVDIDKQPGLRTPNMKGHKILSAPPELPRPAADKRAVKSSGPNTPDTGTEKATQEGFLDGGKDARGAERKCPAMTVPMRRVTIDEVKTYKNLREFFRKSQKPILPLRVTPRIAVPAFGPTSLHQYAHAWRGVANYGAHSVLNIWNPNVQVAQEFSLSQIWVTRGSGSNLETLEAGIQVYPQKYGNWLARLFIYSTSDGYSGNSYLSGCYNLDCGRFVQTNSSWIIAGPFSTYSVASGPQYELELAWLRTSGAWWLYVNGTPIGYYPLNLFDAYGIRNYASTIDFGGEIIDDRTKHAAHTTTDMGSYTQQYPPAGYRRSAYQRRIWYYTSPSTAVWATGLTAARTNAYCYDISTPAYGYYWGIYFYFNGPGYNSNCQ